MLIDCMSETQPKNIGLIKYGKDWDKLEVWVPTRTNTQVRSHLQKYFNRIKEEYNTTTPMDFVQMDTNRQRGKFIQNL